MRAKNTRDDETVFFFFSLCTGVFGKRTRERERNCLRETPRTTSRTGGGGGGAAAAASAGGRRREDTIQLLRERQKKRRRRVVRRFVSGIYNDDVFEGEAKKNRRRRRL